MNVLYALGACLLGLMLVAGWAELFFRIFRVSRLAWPLNLPVGLAVILVVGGMLNALGLAHAPAFDALAVIGVLMAGWTYGRRQHVLGDEATKRQAVAVAVALLLTVIPALFLTPVTVFDFIDDFEKYLAYPMRMLETGTLAGSTLNSTPLETIGGGAFLQGFVLAHAPLGWINLSDAVFGTFLCAVLLMGVAARRGWAATAMAIPAAALVLVLNPQYANVSPLYISAFLVSGIVLLIAENEGRPPAPGLGLMLAALLILKNSMVPFVATAVLAAGLAVLLQHGLRKALRQTAFTMLWVVGGVLPWLAVHRGSIAAILNGKMVPAEVDIPFVPPGEMDMGGLLSFAHLPYGGSYGAYTVVAATGVLISLVMVAENRIRDGKATGTSQAVALLAAAGLAVFVAVMAYSQARDFAHFAVRLLIPTSLGLVTAISVVAIMARYSLTRGAGLGGAMMLLAMFAGEYPDRLDQMAKGQSMVAFRWLVSKPEYQEFSAAAIGDEWRRHLRGIQSKVPEGEGVLVWITTPFALDYARNPLFDTDLMGLSAPWAQMPNVHYVLWEYRGFAVRGMKAYESAAHSSNPNVSRSGRRAIALAQRLQALAARSPVIHYDRNYVLFRTDEDLGGSRR